MPRDEQSSAAPSRFGALDSADVAFPEDGALRINPTPDQLPKPRRPAEQPLFRFDDPCDPDTGPLFRVRYLARTLRGALLEVLAQFRPRNVETSRRLNAVANVDDDDGYRDIQPRGLSSYLALVRIGTCRLFDARHIVSIHDADVLATLDARPEIISILTCEKAIEVWGPAAHIDEGKVRDDGQLGRALTQACACVIHGDTPQPAGIHYRSKHDDYEDCWAIFEESHVTFTHTVPLDPQSPAHKNAVTGVAQRWQIELPLEWGA